MAHEREILRNLSFSLDGVPVSTGASKFGVKLGREKLPWKCFEDAGNFSDKGDWMASATLEGFGKDNEAKLLERLGQPDEDDTSFLLFLESNTQRSPHSSPGDAVLLMTCRTFDVSSVAEKGKIKTTAASFENSDGTRPYFPKVIYTNRAKTPAPMGAGVVTPATKLTLPALVAGYEGVFSVHCTKITGTATVTLLCELLSDTAGFLSPIVRSTFTLFTNENPPSGGHLLGPKSQTIRLDGDATPLPGETQWTIRFTVVDGGTDAQVEVMAAGIIAPKF